ncbi:hypothetical protein [Genomoviridae sp.]|nr:hypothetical protein [Genomoviridae sp.]
MVDAVQLLVVLILAVLAQLVAHVHHGRSLSTKLVAFQKQLGKDFQLLSDVISLKSGDPPSSPSTSETTHSLP